MLQFTNLPLSRSVASENACFCPVVGKEPTASKGVLIFCYLGRFFFENKVKIQFTGAKSNCLRSRLAFTTLIFIGSPKR